jgi:sugar lactone lactonase YvrE
VGGLIGQGPVFVFPKAIAVEATDALVVVDAGLGAVLRVNPQTGDRALVSGCPAIDAQGNCRGTLIGKDLPFRVPWGIAIEGTDALVVDAGLGAVLRVNPQTGARALVSGCAAIDAEGGCVGEPIGGGPPFDLPAVLAVEATGALVVVDAGLGAVVRVDPQTGDRTIVRLGAGRGSGPRLDLPTDLAVEAAGSLVVTDAGLDAVVRVDPQTGDRALVSGCAAIDAEGGCVGEPIGGGPPFDLPAALTVEAAGALVIVDPRRGLRVRVDPHIGAVVRVDPHTGDRTPVSGCKEIDAEARCVGGIIGGGPPFELPASLAIEATGALVVVDKELRAVVRVDPQTGDRTIVSGCLEIDRQRNCLKALIGGQDHPFVIPSGIAIEGTDALVVDGGLGAVLRVNLQTGDRTIVSGCPEINAEGHCVKEIIGLGPRFELPEAMAVEATGALVVVDTGLHAVVRVDPGTGDREIVSDAIIGHGLPLLFPVAIAVEAAGSLVIIDRKIDAVVQVDPHTGDRTIVSVGAE